jgi:hypothetical protein
MNVKKWVLLAGLSLFVVSASGVVIAAEKAVIKIDSIPGKKGAVTFNHGKHINEYKKKGGAEIGCKDCHHTMKSAADKAGAKACTDCHVKPTEAQKGKAPFLYTAEGDKVDQKSVIFHDTCVKCHKAMKDEGKDIGACKTCHK